LRFKDLSLLEGPLLVFGGPYSNLAATRAIRKVAEQRSVPAENIICTGDLVAYCAEPEETVTLIRDWDIHVVMGNCEQSLAERAVDCGCGFEQGSVCSALSVDWFRYADSRVADDTRNWMQKLPQGLTFELAGRRFAVVHGGVEKINRFLFASTPEEIKQTELKLLDTDIDGLIAGHCGIPFGQKISGQVWLNSGVIGMPANDGTADGWYLLIEPVGSELKASWHRLSYPAEDSQRSMRAAGLSAGYADTMISGLWPSEDILPDVEKKNRGKALSLAPLLF